MSDLFGVAGNEMLDAVQLPAAMHAKVAPAGI
jgi:hypothetical protein